MWYLILLLLSSLVGCANRYSEECFYRIWQGHWGWDYGTKREVGRKRLGTTAIDNLFLRILPGDKNKPLAQRQRFRSVFGRWLVAYLAGTRFKSRPGYRLSFLQLSFVYFRSPSRQVRDGVLIRPRQLPSENFQMYYSPIILSFDIVCTIDGLWYMLRIAFPSSFHCW
jgi:hypothetical protein